MAGGAGRYETLFTYSIYDSQRINLTDYADSSPFTILSETFLYEQTLQYKPLQDVLWNVFVVFLVGFSSRDIISGQNFNVSNTLVNAKLMTYTH